MTDHNARQAGLTLEQVEMFASDMVRRGELNWGGFRKDERGHYTIPVVSPSEFKLISALVAAHSADARNAKSAKQRYGEAMKPGEEPSAIERLRFFCSLAMNGQDWIDVEPFFDSVLADARNGEGVQMLRRMLCGIATVGNIDGCDVVRRESMIDLVDRALLVAPAGETVDVYAKGTDQVEFAQKLGNYPAPAAPAPLDVTTIPGYVTTAQASETAEAHAKIGKPMDPCDCAACVKMRGHLYGDMPAAPAPKGDVIVTRNTAGAIVAVTRQDEEGRILSVIAEAAPAPVAQAWWNTCHYQTLFNAIAAATTGEAKGTVGVSVIKFRKAMDAVMPQQSATPADAASERKRKRYTGDPQVEWDEFWKEIVAPDGVLDVEQVKKELADFSMLLNFVPKVYDHATGGAVTYPQTLPNAVISAIDNHVQDLTEKARKEGAEESADAASETDKHVDGIIERFKNPLTPYGLLVRALRIVAGTTLMDMAKYFEASPALLSGMEHGRKPIPLGWCVRVAMYFDSVGVPGMREAIDAAIQRERQQGADRD